MKIGIAFANTGLLGTAEGADALASACESTGVDSVWAVEHVVVPADYESTYPYSREGKMPGGEDVPIPDPLTWLTWFGAHSQTVKLGTGILILPQRNPLVLAKEVATLDALSGGRVRLGVGVGWLQEEFHALGVPFRGRGRRADDYIGALRVLWTKPEPTFESDTVSFERAKMFPKPAQGSVPIIIGGHTEAAARRAGRLGDGFYLRSPRPSPTCCRQYARRPERPGAIPTPSSSSSADAPTPSPPPSSAIGAWPRW